MPVVAIELRIGVMPVRSELRSAPLMASRRWAPSASRASIDARSRVTVSQKVSSTRLMAVMALPSTIPRIGST